MRVRCHTASEFVNNFSYMPPLNIQKRDSLKLQNISDMEREGLRINFSDQALMGSVDYPDGQVTPQESTTPPNVRTTGLGVTKRQIITILILFYVNLINYMDRYTVSGVLIDIQNSFVMSEAESGLLQTAFVLVYMVMAPLFGYLGDRFSRKYLMAIGVFFWCLTTFIGSYMPNYGLFLMCRCFVGVGEASYSTIAPTLISDMFVNDMRSKMLAVFYFAIPVGSGLGYIIGAKVTQHIKTSVVYGIMETEAWRWGLRVTPIMGFIAVLLILFVLQEPPRGHSEGGQHLQATSFLDDLKYLFRNRSFVLSTLAFTCVTFVAGALAWWGPLFVELGVKIQGSSSNTNQNDVGFIFGVTAMLAGLVGVPLGSYLSQTFRRRFTFADPLVCGIGLFLSFPLIMGGMALAQNNTIGSFAVVFFGQLFLNLNWPIVSDIVLYIIIPTRRSSAEALQILFAHALGDAGSPYLIGVVSDAFKPHITPRNLTNMYYMELSNETMTSLYTNESMTLQSEFSTDPDPEETYVKFKSLQYSMFICCSVNVIGALFFFWNSYYIAEDKKKCDRIIAGELDDDDGTGQCVPQPTHLYADEPEIEQIRTLLT